MAASGAPGRRALSRKLHALLAAALAMVLVGAGQARPAASAPPRLNADGAYAFLDFGRSLQAGRPWTDADIRRMAAGAPYRAMIAHHQSLDPTVTPEAFVAMLLALRDGRPYPGPPGRLLRVYLTYKAAIERLPELEARLQAACAAPLVEDAFARARAHLPVAARLPGDVYLLADGFTAAYGEGDAVVLDLLSATQPGEFAGRLAHELHHAGTASLLPEACPSPQLGLALDTLAGMVQEGAAAHWLDRWHVAPLDSDDRQVAGFMRATLAGDLSDEETESWFSALVDDGREGGGPLYRVGNAMIAQLAEHYGDAWVRARLGDPVGLLRAWQDASGPASMLEVAALLDAQHADCPAWFPAGR